MENVKTENSLILRNEVNLHFSKNDNIYNTKFKQMFISSAMLGIARFEKIM